MAGLFIFLFQLNTTFFLLHCMRLPFALLFISLLSLPFAHADVVLLNDSGEKQAIHESIELLEDPPGSLQIADVIKYPAAEKFARF